MFRFVSVASSAFAWRSSPRSVTAFCLAVSSSLLLMTGCPVQDGQQPEPSPPAEPDPAPDAGVDDDAGAPEPSDSGTPLDDAGQGVGADAGGPAPDAGSSVDAGADVDAGTRVHTVTFNAPGVVPVANMTAHVALRGYNPQMPENGTVDIDRVQVVVDSFPLDVELAFPEDAWAQVPGAANANGALFLVAAVVDTNGDDQFCTGELRVDFDTTPPLPFSRGTLTSSLNLVADDSDFGCQTIDEALTNGS